MVLPDDIIHFIFRFSNKWYLKKTNMTLVSINNLNKMIVSRTQSFKYGFKDMVFLIIASDKFYFYVYTDKVHFRFLENNQIRHLWQN